MATSTTDRPASAPDGRRRGELNARELGRWLWRQVTSMRTALVLLLLLALAAVPGSVIPQEGVDSLATTRWKDAHPGLTPVYERLGLFSVYDSVWFSAIYLLLVLSLVGCIVPRTFHYLRAARTPPPRTPRNLTRLPDHATYTTDDDVDAVLARAREVLGRRHRLRADDGDDAVSAERGRLREIGNLVFHLSVLVVLAGFAVGGLLGYQGGVVVVRGDTFVNTSTQYDDFDPGSLFSADDLDPFTFSVDDFEVDWNVQPDSVSGQNFKAPLSYADGTGPRDQEFDLRVNHPLTVQGTDVFLLGHGYAPVITVRDGEGNVAASGPAVFLPQDSSFVSFGVVKAQSARPTQLGLEGLFFPTDLAGDGEPASVFPDDLDPLVSMTVWTGDLGYDSGAPQSVYALDTTNATQVTKADGQPFRVDLRPGERVTLPDGLGTVEFEGVEPWVRLQVSQTPGKRIALAGVVLALLGLLGSLFVRPRRVWVRARREGAGTMVEVAVLDRSGNGEASEVLARIVADLRGEPIADPEESR